MNNKFNTVALAAVLGLGSFGASAGGEAVNCRVETIGKQAIYTGSASCSVNGNYIQQYFHPTPVRTQLVTQWTGSGYAQCWGNVPFYKYENITKQVCDYKPKASITAFAGELEGTIIRVGGSDSDGTVAKKELWINNVKQSSSSVYKVYSPGTYLTIKAKVTDDDGYTDETVRRYNVEGPKCSQGPINEC